MDKGTDAISPKYAVCLILDEEVGGYTVIVPDLPACISEGDTEEDALPNIQEAIELYIEYLTEEGRPIPPPTRATHLVPAPARAVSVAPK